LGFKLEFKVTRFGFKVQLVDQCINHIVIVLGPLL